jgi:hypothetical protein
VTVLGMSDTADFPSQTWTFRVPLGTGLSGGMYRIERVRTATEEDKKQFKGLPGPECPHCGRDTYA